MMLDHVNMFALDLTPILIMHSGIHCKLLNVCIVKWLLLTLGWLGLVYILEDNKRKVYEEELS